MLNSLTCFSLVVDGYSQNSSSGDESVKNEDLLGLLMSRDQSSDLDLVLNPTCNPWSAHIREHLIRTQSAPNKMNGNQSKPSDCINRCVCIVYTFLVVYTNVEMQLTYTCLPIQFYILQLRVQ